MKSRTLNSEVVALIAGRGKGSRETREEARKWGRLYMIGHSRRVSRSVNDEELNDGSWHRWKERRLHVKSVKPRPVFRALYQSGYPDKLCDRGESPRCLSYQRLECEQVLTVLYAYVPEECSATNTSPMKAGE